LPREVDKEIRDLAFSRLRGAGGSGKQRANTASAERDSQFSV